MFGFLGKLSGKILKLKPIVQNNRYVCKNFRQDTTIVSPPPFLVSMGGFKFVLAICSSLYLGSMIAKYGASYLEENEIFIPQDDDDDD
uniref:Essential MCU regulator, mitochondrial n=1 Tax=Strongyloides papillosus TaxID=174720 RepID=A0A0N5CGY3_STREA